jgi:hypothetical protein
MCLQSEIFPIMDPVEVHTLGNKHTLNIILWS